MHVVVNHLPVKPDADWPAMAAKFKAFADDLRRDHPMTRAAVLAQAGPGEAIMIVFYEDETAMKQVSSSVAAPWFAENIRPFLSGPAQRSAAEVLAASGAV